MGTLHVDRFGHSSAKLWPLIGPIATSREAQKELGGPIFSDDHTIWFVARDGKDVVGVASVRATPKGYWLACTYVVPARRKKGAHKKLADVRDAYIATLPKLPVMVCCRAERWPHYKRLGFAITQERGSWVYGAKS